MSQATILAQKLAYSTDACYSLIEANSKSGTLLRLISILASSKRRVYRFRDAADPANPRTDMKRLPLSILSFPSIYKSEDEENEK